MLSHADILGEIFDRLDDGVLVLSNADRRHRVIYHNARYRELWSGTSALQQRGEDYTYPHEELINKAIMENRPIKKTLQVNNGSVVRFFNLKLFPANESHYIEISRDITETYIRHNRDREYKSLFLSLFEKSSVPTALINISGIVIMVNPQMYLELSDQQTVSALGTLVWLIFPNSQYELKERFEQLVRGGRDFEVESYVFSGVKHQALDPDIPSMPENPIAWVLMKKIRERSKSIAPVEDPELVQLKEAIRTYNTLIRFAQWLQGLPWGIIAAIVVAASGGGFWFLGQRADPPQNPPVQVP